MVVDELVTLLQFDLPAQSRAALSSVDKAIGGITGKLKGLGIVSAVTSGLFAGFSVNAAREATSLANLSDAIGVNKAEIQALGAVYKQLGGNAKSFASDAQAYKAMTGRNLDLAKMVELSRTFSSMSKDAAYQLGRAYGFSDDMIRVLRQGPDELKKMAEYGKQWGTTSEKALNNLRALDKQWTKTSINIDTVANEVQGAFAPTLTAILKDFEEFLQTNKQDIVEGAETIAKGLIGAWEKTKAAGKAASEALKPAWDVLDKFVKDHGGWANAIEKVTLVLEGLAAITIPGVLIGGIASLAGVLGGLGAAATTVASILGPGGVLLFALAGATVAVKGYLNDVRKDLDEVDKNIDSLEARRKELDKAASPGGLGAAAATIDTPTVEKIIAQERDIQKAAKEESGNNFWNTADNILRSLLHGDPGNAIAWAMHGDSNADKIANVIEGSRQNEVTLMQYGDREKEIIEGIENRMKSEQSGILAGIGNFFKSAIGVHGEKSEAQIKADALEEYQRTFIVPRLQARQERIPLEASPGSVEAAGGTSSPLTTGQTNINIYAMTAGDTLAEISKALGTTAYGRSSSM